MHKIVVSLFLVFSVKLLAVRPNILIIQADDLGYDDLSVNGNPLSKTPNLDQLSKESVRFEKFVLCSVCSPSRASLLTGRDFWRTGVSAMHGGNDYMHLDEKTFGNVFQENGYATGMWGKWHSGKSDGYWPWDRGFDEAYYAKLYNYYPSRGWHNQYPKMTTHTGKWSPTVLVDYTIDFISRNKEKPFLAYLSFLTCHDKWKTPDEYKEKYLKMGRTDRYATLLGMLEYMDKEVGRLLQHLTDNGLDENTIVLFLSDNGPNLGDTGTEEWALRNNHGFKGMKSKLWQNGIKSPLYIRWKGTYEPTEVNRLVSVTDIYPTLIEMAGLEIPKDNLPLNGRSITSYLRGDTKSLSPKQAVFAGWFPVWKEDQFSPMQVEDKTKLRFEEQRMTLIDERYKFMQNINKMKDGPDLVGNLALFDMNISQVEDKNIYGSNRKLANGMQAYLKDWFADIKNEDHAFSAPVFQIGWKGKKLSEVRTYGASKCKGVKNSSHKILGFDEVGDYAEYKINVHEAGFYTVTIESMKAISGLSLELSCNGKKSSGDLNGKSSELGKIELTKGEHTMQLKVIRAGGKQITPLTSLQFERF